MAMTQTAVPAHVQLIQMGTAWTPTPSARLVSIVEAELA